MMAALGRQLNELKSVAAITYERNVLAACRT